MPLDPQARAVLDALEALGGAQPGTVSAVESRTAAGARPLPAGAPVASVDNRSLPGPAHGGGWVLGSLDAGDHTCPSWSACERERGVGPHPSFSSGLLPALVITAEFDPLRDEGELLAARLQAAGAPVVVTRYERMIHGFFGMFRMIDKGKDAVRQASQALASAFALQPV